MSGGVNGQVADAFRHKFHSSTYSFHSWTRDRKIEMK
jgi:hypothetical protein